MKMKTTSYKTDGLIFVESTQNYNNTKNLKWKPYEFLTIDFMAVKCAPGQYILMVGISSKMKKQFNIADSEYVNLLKTLPITINEEYVPIPFINSLIPHIYHYDNTGNGVDKGVDLHGHIIELSLDKDLKWVFHRIRYDRDVELNSGSYYGNNYKVAETTLMTILNPLLMKDLMSSPIILSKDMYFKKQDMTYQHVKKFNNYVKKLLIMRYKNDTILDLASGRGGDLNKYIAANTRNLIMLEIDINAIEEVIDRKYNILTKINASNASGCNLIILQVDLNKDFKKNIDIIGNNCDNKQFPVIHCHFAMHYLLGSIKSATNIISFINHYLEKNGTFVITIFDGKKVFDLLSRNNGKWQSNNKYMISYKGKMPSIFKGFNHKIDVLLPLSNKPYEEPLIDLMSLDTLFKKSNIFRTEEKSFGNMMTEYMTYNTNYMNNLTDDDKTFIELYKYVIYTKK